MSLRRLPPLAAATLVVSLALTGCGEGTATVSDPTVVAPAGNALPEVVTDENDVVTGFDFSETDAPGDELEVAVLREGDGAVVETGQAISVFYLGQTYDGTDPDNEPFDGNYGGSPVAFPIGVGGVIAGWDQALVGQTVGSRVLMGIPSDLGYGDDGSPPQIPGGATLYFVVDIVDAQ